MTGVDLLITAPRIFCADLGLDGSGGVAVAGNRIVASGPEVSADRVSAKRIIEVLDGVLLPGLVDFHGHPDRRSHGSKYGVDPDVEFLPRGVTTVVSQGDAGALDWADYRRATVEQSRTRVLMALNLGARGEAMSGGSLADDADLDAAACARICWEHRDLIWGIAVNTSVPVTGQNDPRTVLRRALEAAELAGRPLLFGSRREADLSLDEQLAFLRPGDVLTYCYSGTPENILEGPTGRVRATVREARERGVVFDVGHGMASFDFDVAEAALADSFPPDTISTDQYRRHVGSDPQHDLPRTISKLMAVGMPEREAFTSSTLRPARLLGLAGEIGTLRPGACADLVALRWNADGKPLVDVSGVSRPGGCWEPVLVVRGGQVIRTPEAAV